MRVYLANDIGMNLGKEIAQAAHAVGLAWLSHSRIVREDGQIIELQLTGSTVDKLLGVHPEIVRCSASELPLDDEFHQSIIDSGRTVFAAPTKTCVVDMEGLGPIVPVPDRLKFDDKVIDVKQGLFVNRSAFAGSGLDESDLIAGLAKASSEAIGFKFTENNRSVLTKGSSIYSWLTQSFGKTVVGTKKFGKFNELRSLLIESNTTCFDFYHNDELIGFAIEPLKELELHQYTKFKTFRLL